MADEPGLTSYRGRTAGAALAGVLDRRVTRRDVSARRVSCSSHTRVDIFTARKLQVAGYLPNSEFSAGACTAANPARSLECHFDDKGDPAEFVSFASTLE
jgi:hypothetical protein